MKKTRAIASLLALVGSAAIASPPASEWTIGPHIRGKNYSVGMPPQPAPTRGGWTFDFPDQTRADGHVHYVTFRPESLANKSSITVRYRIDASSGTNFIAQENEHLPATVSLFFQRRGDNWSARGPYNFYRWYAPPDTVKQISAGVHQMTVRLNDPFWTPVMGGAASDHPRDFRAALANPAQIGLVFGSTAGRGHGVFATGSARFELLSFEVN